MPAFVATPAFGMVAIAACYLLSLLGVTGFLLALSRAPTSADQREREATFLRQNLSAVALGLVTIPRRAA